MIALPVLLAALIPVLGAQDDPSHQPLGDVARSLRRKNGSSRQVIDDDNFSTVMEKAENSHTSGSGLRFLMAGDGKGFHVSAPDVTCSLAFSANTKALLSRQYAEMDLPPAELAKLEGPAVIEGDALIIAAFNGTQWHVSELAVALTLVNKSALRDASLSEDINQLPAGTLAEESAIRPEKKPDTVTIYRMRAAALPWATTVFSARLNRDLAPGEEWHWAIVQAKGYPPQNYDSTQLRTTAQTKDPQSIQTDPLPPATAEPEQAVPRQLPQ